MTDFALLIDYQYCSGCHSCELACRNALGLGLGEWGIKVLEDGPRQRPDGSWQWDYVPNVSDLCDGCASRTAESEMPSCVQHCQAHCLEWGTATEMAEAARRLGRRAFVWAKEMA